MELTPKYLTYSEYQDLGGDLKESSFKLLEYRSEKQIDLYTFNRFRKTDEYPAELKTCVFDLIPIVNEDGTRIISESIGSYSVTKKDRKQVNTDIQDIIKTYLSNTLVDNIPVLYIGADED